MNHNNTPEQIPRTLIIDDDAMMRLLLRETLERQGFWVEEAEHGAAGLALFAKAKPDVVLLDVMMPEMDGFTVCAELRKLPKGGRLPILMMTGLDDADSINRAYDVGATDFITKPINWEVLGHRVRYMLRASHAFEGLAKSAARLIDAQRIARLGNWDWDIEAGVVDWSDEVPTMLGKLPGEVDISPEGLLTLVHRDDRESVKQSFMAALKSSSSVAADCRIVFADGSEHILDIQAKVIRDPCGKATRMHGTIQDITERKDAEERIRLTWCLPISSRRSFAKSRSSVSIPAGCRKKPTRSCATRRIAMVSASECIPRRRRRLSSTSRSMARRAL